jgi:hypothetical protein
MVPRGGGAGSPCGIVAARGVVGATNILAVGRAGAIQGGIALPTVVRYAHPVKVSRGHPSSSSDTPEIARRRRVYAPTARSPRINPEACHNGMLVVAPSRVAVLPAC